MTDHPIIFSAPMVRTLLEGRMTQIRRLISSPLAKARPGDRLWVREGFMPRRASRLTLVVEGVRRQRIQDIDETDVLAEGLVSPGWPDNPNAVHPRDLFAVVWGYMHKNPGTRWADNPKIAVITFRTIQCNIDVMEEA